ncbi:MAG TPA: 2-C-methyl-D-erythritol 4-phosphate cytidylyltransferase [Acidimicrobiales bacterium]|nr:2-C-methyl-D-erythritol 4-phosphate cytidylyltransferase [Acidimicrobiales bacterium]
MAQVWAIVVAAGAGQRFGQRKQFALLSGHPVVAWAVNACRRCSAGVVLVVPPGTDTEARHGADIAVEGGPTRSDSVRRGLAQVPPEAEVIIVHDAARPLASDELFHAVIAAVTEEGVAGAVPGLAVSDTIKQVDGAMQVIATLHRDSLVAVQTPQAFRADDLRRAHAGAGEATDDAALVEASGATVRIVPGDAGNLKITTPADLRAAEQLLGG